MEHIRHGILRAILEFLLHCPRGGSWNNDLYESYLWRGFPRKKNSEEMGKWAGKLRELNKDANTQQSLVRETFNSVPPGSCAASVPPKRCPDQDRGDGSITLPSQLASGARAVHWGCKFPDSSGIRRQTRHSQPESSFLKKQCMCWLSGVKTSGGQHEQNGKGIWGNSRRALTSSVTWTFDKSF